MPLRGFEPETPTLRRLMTDLSYGPAGRRVWPTTEDPVLVPEAGAQL